MQAINAMDTVKLPYNFPHFIRLQMPNHMPVYIRRIPCGNFGQCLLHAVLPEMGYAKFISHFDQLKRFRFRDCNWYNLFWSTPSLLRGLSNLTTHGSNIDCQHILLMHIPVSSKRLLIKSADPWPLPYLCLRISINKPKR